MAIYLHIAARTDRGRIREKNEDSYLAVDFTRGESSRTPLYEGRFPVGDRGALIALSDGMGGAAAGRSGKRSRPVLLGNGSRRR